MEASENGRMVGGGGTSDKDDPCYRSPSPGKKSRPLVDFFYLLQ